MAKKEKELPQSEGLVQARIKPGNRYAGKRGGEIVEVDPRELKRIPHCLISLDEEARLKDLAAAPPEATDAQLHFRSLKRSYVAAAKSAQENRARALREMMTIKE